MAEERLNGLALPNINNKKKKKKSDRIESSTTVFKNIT
jgi:phage replication-related protein YjqB (UPF0714/DUF867 family)